MSTDRRPPELLRADGARNLHRIIEVAARMLGDDPHAGMADVAAAAGVSRATVYRRFPTREALLDAIREQATEQGRAAVEACRLEEGPAAEALARLVRAWLDLAVRYSFPQLSAQPRPHDSAEARERRRRVFLDPVHALVRRGQRAGEFDPALPAGWAAAVVPAMLMAGAKAVADGTLAPDEAPDTVWRTLMRGLCGEAR